MANRNPTTNNLYNLSIEEPGALLATYGFLIKGAKSSLQSSLIKTTTRLLRSYLAVEAKFSELVNQKNGGVLGWFKARSGIKKAAAVLEKSKAALVEWIDKSLSYYGVSGV